MAKNTTLPTVGIRPTIDGRRMGVRESLEDLIMNQAKNVAAFIEANVRHASGEPVQCVIADTCIGGMVESAACEDKFRANNVGVSLTVTSCWCYGSETIDMDPLRPKAVWGFNGTERPGAVYLAAALAGHNQKGLPAFSIYGHDVQDAGDTVIPADVQDKILRFVRSGIAVATMRGKSYLSIGGVSMGIAGSIVDHAFFEKYFGMKVQHVDMTELKRRMDKGIYNKAELQKAYDWAKANFVMGANTNPPENQRTPAEDDRILKQSILMAIIIRDMMKGNPALKRNHAEEAMGYNAILSGFQGQRHWTDQYPNGDTAEALLNSSFDWNGVREAITVATENDSLNGLCQLFGHLLTGTASIFADVRTYWSPEAVKRVAGKELSGEAKGGIIHLINSGSASLDGTGQMKDSKGKPVMKPHWDVTPADAEACLKATTWYPAIHEYFRGGGYSSNFLTKGGMPFTMTRLNLVEGLGPVLQIAEGWSVDIDPKIHDILNKRTDKTWPTTWFVPRLTGKGAFKDVYSVMANWGANHGSLTFGHVGADFVTLASMLRIPVCMHNLSDDSLFRPSAWAAHGMDTEGSDYRACLNYGPVYR